MSAKQRIVAVLFTWSWTGFVVRYEDGRLETFSPGSLYREVGPDQYQRLSRIAHQLDGHWHPVEE
jgi:hypothetical protein